MNITTIEHAIRYCMARNTYAYEDGLDLAEHSWTLLSEATRRDVIDAVAIGLSERRLTRERLGYRWPTIDDAYESDGERTS